MKKVKELYRAVEQSKDLNKRAELLFELSKLLLQKNPAKAKESAQELLELGKKIEAIDTIGQAYLIHGSVCYKALELDEAEQHFLSAQKILKHSNDDMLKCRIAMSLGKVFWARSDQEHAMGLYQSILPAVSAGNDLLLHAELLSNIGNVYDRLGQPDLSEKYYKDALELLKGTELEDEGLYIRSNLAIIKGVRGHFAEEIEDLLVCLDGFKKVGNKRDISIVRINMAIAYCEMKLYAESLNEYQQSMKLLKDLDDKRSMITVHIGISYVYIHLNGHKDAIDHAQKSIDLARNIGYPVGLFDGLIAISKAYLGAGEVKKAKVIYEEAAEIAKDKGLTHAMSRQQHHAKALQEAEQ